MPRIAVYARVSTADQSLAPQLDALREYAARRGSEATEYADHGVSGARDRRPALDRLLADARKRRFDVLAVTKLDRLARSVRHLTSMGAELEALGIDLVVLDQAIDTSTPSGKLLFNVLGSIAEFERDLIRERTVAGLVAARRRGAQIGRPRAIVGVKALGTLERLFEGGVKIVEIAKALGVSTATVSRETRRLGLQRAA